MRNYNKIFSVLLMAGITLFASCNKEDDILPVVDENEAGEMYVFSLRAPGGQEGTEYAHIIKDIKADKSYTLNEASESALPTGKRLVYNNKIYGVFSQQNKFSQYELNEEGGIEETKSIVSTLGYESILFHLEDGKAIALGYDYFADGQIEYELLDLTTLTNLKQGKLAIPAVEGHMLFPNTAIQRGDQLLVSYAWQDINTYEGNAKAYLSIFDINTLEHITTIEDSRSNSLGYDAVQDHFFAENGDLYIATSNTDYWGINENQPWGVFRIKAGENRFDPDFFIDLTAATEGKFGIGFQPLGNGKAIIKAFNKELINSYSDFNDAFATDAFVVDVNTQSVTKLDVPRHRNAWVPLRETPQGEFILPINSQEGNYVYIIDPATLEVQRGAKYEGADIIRDVFVLTNN